MKKRPRKKHARAQVTQIWQRDALEFQLFLAADALWAGQLEDCERAARKALRIDSRSRDATVLLCQALHFRGRHLEAVGYLREAVHAHPKDAMLHLHLAGSLYEAGRLDEATRALRQVEDRARSGPPRDGAERGKLLRAARALGRQIRIATRAAEAGPPPGGGEDPRGSSPIRRSRRPEQPSQFPEPGSVPDPGVRTSAAPAFLESGRARAEPAPGRMPRGQAPSSGAADARGPAPPVPPSSGPLLDASTSGAPVPRAPGAGAAAGAAATARCDPATLLPAGSPATAPSAAPVPKVTVRLEEGRGRSAAGALPAWIDDPWSDDLAERDLLMESQRIALRVRFDELLCLPTLAGVERLDYQIETARKILRSLKGRALLCDEVGLGKTIEAGMVIKEYLLRGMVRRVLVLVPPGLVGQWRDELSSKFGLEFRTWAGGDAGAASADGAPLLVLGSIALARLARNLEAFTGLDWDLVVVDEAHHLRRRGSRSWALVNLLRKRFLLLLSATPVHNNLTELYELVTLVRPGLLGTPGEFRSRFLEGSEGRRARDPDRLRELLGEVMVRNTRSHADVALPRRFATTLVVDPHASEAAAYGAASAFAALAYPGAGPGGRMALRHLLAAGGNGPRALAELAGRWVAEGRPVLAGDGAPGPDAAGDAGADSRQEARRLLASAAEAARAAGSAKADRLRELVAASDEQIVIYCRYRATLGDLAQMFAEAGISHEVYHGALAPREKDAVIGRFREGARVLLSTESGGEGRNIQFCRTIVNFDLPWDPMRIEQRIGRVHRIGQRRDVFVFNLVLSGTLEEELLRLLEEKIHLFELIVGEVDSILGNLDRREEFAEILLDLWAGSRDPAERRERFKAFGEELAAARAAYEQGRALGDSLFADDLEA